MLRYSQGSRHNGFSLTGMAYQGQWTSTDQVARRAVDSGLVGRFGTLDPTTGGETHRYSLSGEWAKRWESAQSKANAWWLKSGLDLWSNFQYCASNGCPPGDQFKQAERRQAGGFAVSHAMFDRWGGFDVENSIGLQGSVDHLNPVGLYWTSGRQTQSTVREDKVTSAACRCGCRTKRDGLAGFGRYRACAPMPTISASIQALPPTPARPATRC